MNISASQYNSAGESGWTHYLDESSLSGNYFQSDDVDYGGKGARMQEEEEEDLSMVSDASSGPPHYRDDYDDEYRCENSYTCLSSTSQNTKEFKKKVVKEYSRSQQPLYLDDASSSVFSCSKMKVNFSGNGAVENALDFSHDFSTTRIKVPSPHLLFIYHILLCCGQSVGLSRESLNSKRTSVSLIAHLLENELQKKRVVSMEDEGNKIKYFVSDAALLLKETLFLLYSF